jgi:hypothetical protein
MRSITELKILLAALESSRSFCVCSFLTAQYNSECPVSGNDTEQESVAIFVGEMMINTLLDCINNKTRKLVL